MKQTQRQNGDWSSMKPSTDRVRGKRCDRAAEWEVLLYDFAEELTDEKTTKTVRDHIAECEYCRGALEDIRFMTAALRESVPEPKADISARVMAAIRAEEESDGHMVLQTIDAQTGRVLSNTDTGKKHGIRRIARVVSGIAAVILVVFGLVYVLPLLRMGAGTAAGTQEILGEMQSGEDDRFSGGVFVGSTTQTTEEPTADEPLMTETVQQRLPVVLRIAGLSDERLWDVLSVLTTADGDPVTVLRTEDGYLISPLSAFEEAQKLLAAAYPELGVEIIRAETMPDSYTEDAFYIQIN